jgi:hypothetical protein
MITTTTTVVVTIIVALITAVIGPIIVNWVKLKMEKTQKGALLTEALESSALIDHQLDDIMQELNCDRVWIAQFHNGGHFYPTGKSIQKFSVFYEKCNPVLPPLQTTFQNIPVSLFSKALSQVHQHGELEILDVEVEENTFGIDVLTSQFKTKSLCMVGLYDLNNHLIGVMGISFIDEHNVVTPEWIFIRQKVGVIGTLLSEYLYPNNKK